MKNELYIKASITNCPELAVMNKQLIIDEEHSNKMSVHELENRMINFISEGYEAYLLLEDSITAGYCLFRPEIDHIYIRQFFIKSEYRRKGAGKRFITWMKHNVWKEKELVIDVLCNNTNGIDFWRSIGFLDYCITMKMK
jgi:predicted acetyltransferase